MTVADVAELLEAESPPAPSHFSMALTASRQPGTMFNPGRYWMRVVCKLFP